MPWFRNDSSSVLTLAGFARTVGPFEVFETDTDEHVAGCTRVADADGAPLPDEEPAEATPGTPPGGAPSVPPATPPARPTPSTPPPPAAATATPPGAPATQNDGPAGAASEETPR